MTMGVWKKTAVSFWHDDFIVFQKLKHTFTSFEIQYVWHTAAKENGFYFVLFYCIKKKKKEHCEGLKPQVRRQNRHVKLRKYSNWSGQTVTFCFFLQTIRVEERCRTAEGVKYCFWDFFCHKYWKVKISVHCYSVDFLCLTLYLAVSLRRALRKKINMIKTNKPTNKTFRVLHVKFAVTTPTCNTDQHSGRAAKESGE